MLRKKVLIVESNEIELDILAKLLIAKKFHVVTAISTKEASNKIKEYETDSEKKIDALLIDVAPNLKNGKSFINNLKRDYPELAIVAFSADKKFRELSYAAGANCFLLKPLTSIAGVAFTIDHAILASKFFSLMQKTVLPNCNGKKFNDAKHT